MFTLCLPSGILLVSGNTKSPRDCQRSPGGGELTKEEVTVRRRGKTSTRPPTTCKEEQKLATLHLNSQNMQNDYMKDPIHCY